MKIAYFGYNLFSSCLDLFIRRGDEVACIYTGENGHHTDRVINLAEQYKIPLCFDKPDKTQMDELVRSGVEFFFVAEYPWKIPLPDGLKFAINSHPTMLPEGRGPTPMPSLILQHSQHAGITLHKMASEFDEGDILLQKQIDIDENESFDTLSAKLYIETPLLLDKLLSNLDRYYENSTPQGEGSYWPKLTRQHQTIDWNRSTAELLRQIRAFGSLCVYAEINGHDFLMTAAEGVVHQHDFKAGTVVSVDQFQLVVASSDGLISISSNCLTKLT